MCPRREPDEATYPAWVPRSPRLPLHDGDDASHPENYVDPEAALQRTVREAEIEEELGDAD